MAFTVAPSLAHVCCHHWKSKRKSVHENPTLRGLNIRENQYVSFGKQARTLFGRDVLVVDREVRQSFDFCSVPLKICSCAGHNKSGIGYSPCALSELRLPNNAALYIRKCGRKTEL